MSAAEKISDASEIDEALALAAAQTQGSVPANDNLEIITGGISKELMEAIQKKAAQKVAQKIREVSELSGLVAGLAEEAANDDAQQQLAEELEEQENANLQIQEPPANRNQNNPKDTQEEIPSEPETKSEANDDDTEGPEIATYRENPQSAPQQALDNFGEDSNEDDELPEDQEPDGNDFPGTDQGNPMETPAPTPREKKPQTSKESNEDTAPDEDSDETPTDDPENNEDYQDYLDDMRQSGKELDEDGNRAHTDEPLSPEDWQKDQENIPEQEAELNDFEQNKNTKPKKQIIPEVSQNSNQEKKYDQFDAANDERNQNNPNNVPGGAHPDQTEGTDASQNGEASQGESPQTDGSEYMKPGSAPAERNKLTQMINKSRFDKELQEIDKKIKQLQMEIDYTDMPPIRKLTKEISGVKKKIRNLNIKIVLYSVIGAFCFLLSAVLAVTIIGILVAGPVMYQGINMFIKVGILSAEKELLKKQIKDKETSIKMQMMNVKMKQKKIGQLAVNRSKIINQSLLSRNPQAKQNNQ